jgi:hypothetical protein
MDEVMEELRAEIAAADQRYGPFTSSHEGYGVLAEEVAELLTSLRLNKIEGIRLEAIQVAAVALRLARCCRDNESFALRSNCR